ncbi:hypothetical protein D3C72_1587420 [compost metagenome]
MLLLLRTAISPSDVTAFEAAIKYMRELLLLFAAGDQTIAQRRGAAFAPVGAQVEVWQLTVEQTWDNGGNGMGVEQQRVTVLGFQARQFVLQLLVVRLPDLFQIAGALLVRGGFTRQEARSAVKQYVRIQTGGGGSIKRFVVGWTVQVDNKARIIADQYAGTHGSSEIVQLWDMPVGIGQWPCIVGQAGFDGRCQSGTGMGNTDQQRQAAGVEL